MSEPLRGLVISHGGLGDALVDAVTKIAGPSDGLVAITNEGCGRATLCERITAALGAGPTMVFVDLPGGSCFQAAARLMHERDDLSVVAGVNLPMLLEFVFHRDDSLPEAAARAAEAGTKGIQLAPP